MRLILILLLTLNLLQAKKIALLIGNDDYSFAPLQNPLNDVDGIYQTLKEIGFDISEKDVLKNASKTEMETALANFSQKAQSAEIALTYFSGHGMQVNNVNYMLPAKTNPKKPVDLFGLVDLNYFIQSATSAKYGIVLVDACRNNPLVKYFQNGKHKGSAKKGLGQVTPKTGQVVIGFATSAGDTADDGNGNMSPYAKALSERLKDSDDIRNILGKVGKEVSKEYEQNPIYRANLAESVYLSNNSVDDITIRIFFEKLISLMEDKKINKFMKYFSDEVLYYGSYKSKESISNSKQKYLNKWDNLDYEIISIDTTIDNDIVKIDLLMNFEVQNSKKLIKGKVTATYKLNSKNKIIYENSTVLSKKTKIYSR